MHVRVTAVLTIAVAVSLSAGCGDQGDSGTTGTRSGITGQVHLGPQCPVETKNGPCADKPAPGSNVTVAKQLPGDSHAGGDVVARTTTDIHGIYRIALAPGKYVITANAGMSCGLMDARVHAGGYSKVDIACDTGIR
jgi:hypothetical protein